MSNISNIAVISTSRLCAEALSEIIAGYSLIEANTRLVVIDNPSATINFDQDEIDLAIFLGVSNKEFSGKYLYYSIYNPNKISAIIDDIKQALRDNYPPPLSISKNILLDKSRRNLKNNASGMKIALTEKEQDLLLFLYDVGEADREEILAKIWGISSNIDTHTLETHIYRLRQKLRELADYEYIIATDKGYRFCEHE